MKVFKDYAYYYNLFYGDKDYRSEAEIIDRLLKKYSKRQIIEHVLNLGCGTGRHDLELNTIGYHMHGMDLSKDMIEIARKSTKGKKGIEFEVADVRNFDKLEEYDAAISLFHVMSYQNKNEEIMSSFKNINRALKTGGLFIFDCWYGPGVLADRPANRIKKAEDDNNVVIRYAEPIMHPNKNIVDVCYNVLIINKDSGQASKIYEEHNMRYFFYPEIEFMLNCSGFELVDCLDCMTIQKPDFNSWTSYFIAVKK